MANTLDRQSPNWIFHLFKDVSIAPLVVFRILFGFLIFLHATIFILDGSLHEYFVKPHYIFTFIGFEFLQIMRGNGMYGYFGIMAALGLMVMFGFYYKISIISLCVFWQLAYLVQKVNYNNHYYLMLLLCYIMAFVPAHRYFSVDAWRRPSIGKTTCAQWIYFLFMAQVTILYAFAALNKLNPGWLSGEFFEAAYFFRKPFPLIGSLYGHNWFRITILWGGLLFDLLLCPLLFWKRTRTAAFILACCFHLLNAYLFSIKVFPYLSIALLVFFFDPTKVSQFLFRRTGFPKIEPTIGQQKKVQWGIIYGLALYLVLQVAIPLRHLFYPGNTDWTEEGHRMSWRMMLRIKKGEIHFTAQDKITGRKWTGLEKRLTTKQQSLLATRPDIVWQFAQYLKKEFAAHGYPHIQVYATGSVSLNNQLPQPMIDSATDLAQTKWYAFRHSAWILPFKKD